MALGTLMSTMGKEVDEGIAEAFSHLPQKVHNKLCVVNLYSLNHLAQDW